MPGQSTSVRLGPAALALAAGACALALILVRLGNDGLAPYGFAAEYATHDSRLVVLAELRAAGPAMPWELMRRIDGAYPPGLHVAAALWGAPWGHDVPAVAALPILAWAGLILAIVRLAHHLHPGSGPFAAMVAAPLPLLQGAATRYYHDLPCASAWTWGLVLLLVGERGSRTAPLGTAVLWTLAALTKWTVLPWLGIGAALALLHTRTLAPPMAALGGTALLLLVAGGGSFDFQSLSVMADSVSGGGGVAAMVDDALAMAGDPCRWLDPPWAAFRTAVGPTASALLITLVALPIHSGRGHGPGGLGLPPGPRRAAVLFGAASIAQVLVSVLLLPVRDERLLLFWCPLLAASAGVRLAAHWDLGRRAPAILVAVVLLTQAVEWNLGVDGPWSARRGLDRCPGLSPGATVSVATSSDRSTVLRRGDEPADDAAERARIGALVRHLPDAPVATTRGSALLGDRPDNAWLAYVLRRDAVLGGGHHRPLHLIEPGADPPPGSTLILSVREARLWSGGALDRTTFAPLALLPTSSSVSIPTEPPARPEPDGRSLRGAP